MAGKSIKFYMWKSCFDCQQKSSTTCFSHDNVKENLIDLCLEFNVLLLFCVHVESDPYRTAYDLCLPVLIMTMNLNHF